MLKKITRDLRWWLRERLLAFFKGPSPRQQPARSIWHLYQDLIWLGFAAAVNTYINVYAIRLGASKQLLGLRSSLPSLIVVLLRVPAAQMMERSPDRKRLIVGSLLGARIFYLLIFLLPWLHHLPLLRQIPQAQLLIWLVILMGVPNVLSAAGWDTFFADVVPARDRAHVVSMRSTMRHIMLLSVVPLLGLWLEWAPFPLNYQLVFLIAFIGAMLSTWHVHKIKVPSTAVPPRRKARALNPREMWRILREMREFGVLVLGTFVYQWGISVAAPLYNVYFVEILGATESWIGLRMTLASVMSILAFRFWPRRIEERGDTTVLKFVAPMMMLFPLLTGFSRTLTPNLFIVLIPRMFGAGVVLSRYNILLRASPEDRRPTYIAIYAILNNVAAFVAPLVGVQLANWFSIHTVFFISAALRFLAGMVYWQLPKAKAG